MKELSLRPGGACQGKGPCPFQSISPTPRPVSGAWGMPDKCGWVKSHISDLSQELPRTGSTQQTLYNYWSWYHWLKNQIDSHRSGKTQGGVYGGSNRRKSPDRGTNLFRSSDAAATISQRPWPVREGCHPSTDAGASFLMSSLLLTTSSFLDPCVTLNPSHHICSLQKRCLIPPLSG